MQAKDSDFPWRNGGYHSKKFPKVEPERVIFDRVFVQIMIIFYSEQNRGGCGQDQAGRNEIARSLRRSPCFRLICRRSTSEAAVLG